jgi:hypothetical protein
VGFLTQLAVDPIADRLAGVTDRAVREVAVRRRGAVERAVADLRARHPDHPPVRLAREAVAERARRVAGTGAVTALPALVPVAGTATEIGAAIGDVSWLTFTQVELILLLACLYERPLDDPDARRLDVLLVLGHQAGVVKLRPGPTLEVLGARYGRDDLRGAKVDALAGRVNRRLAQLVVARLARRRATIVLGRAIPVVGIGIAAGFNLWSTRRIGATAIRYFEHLV